MNNRAETGAGVSFCWECNRKLQRAPGRGLGLFYFRRVVDRAGIEHRMHADCAEREAVAGNVKLKDEKR